MNSLGQKQWNKLKSISVLIEQIFIDNLLAYNVVYFGRCSKITLEEQENFFSKYICKKTAQCNEFKDNILMIIRELGIRKTLLKVQNAELVFDGQPKKYLDRFLSLIGSKSLKPCLDSCSH